MDDIYSAMFGDDMGEQKASAQALAAALRGQRGLGQAFQLHPLLAQQGSALVQDAQAQQKGFGDLAQNSQQGRFQQLLQQNRAAAEMEMQKQRAADEMVLQGSRDAAAMKRLRAEMGGKASKADHEDWKTVDTDKGLMLFNPRTSELRAPPTTDGQPLLSAATAEKQKADAGKKASQVVEVEDRFQQIKDRIGSVRQRIKDDGTWELFGPHNDLINQELSDIAVDMAKVKDPTGVARPGDVEIEMKTLPAPGLSRSNDSALQLLDNYERNLETRRAGAYKVRGLQLPGAKREPAGNVDLTSGKVRIKDKTTGRMGWAPSRNEIPEGAEEVK